MFRRDELQFIKKLNNNVYQYKTLVEIPFTRLLQVTDKWTGFCRSEESSDKIHSDSRAASSSWTGWKGDMRPSISFIQGGGGGFTPGIYFCTEKPIHRISTGIPKDIIAILCIRKFLLQFIETGDSRK